MPENTNIYESLKKMLNDLVFAGTKNCPLYWEESPNNKYHMSPGETMGVEFYALSKSSETKGYDLSLQLWLLNPNPKYESLKQCYSQGALATIKFNEDSGLEKITKPEEFKELIFNESFK
ncbi:MAG: hypothetical protein WC393_00650 [Candidatus Nanoarchaeia archaeon]|jgi:hypothetical protein